VIIIAHRGNIDGPDSLQENHPDFIDDALKLGFDVEIDLRIKDGDFYLGHDKPTYKVSLEWIYKRKEKLWIHCKDRESLDNLSSSYIDFHYFYHTTDQYTLTSHAIGWICLAQLPIKNAIIVLPEEVSFYDDYDRILQCKGICTNKPIFYKKELNGYE